MGAGSLRGSRGSVMVGKRRFCGYRGYDNIRRYGQIDGGGSGRERTEQKWENFRYLIMCRSHHRHWRDAL